MIYPRDQLWLILRQRLDSVMLSSVLKSGVRWGEMAEDDVIEVGDNMQSIFMERNF